MTQYQFNPKTGQMTVSEPISRITIDEVGIVKSEERLVDGIVTQYFEYEDGGSVTIKKLEGSNDISGHKVTVNFQPDADKPGHVHATYKMSNPPTGSPQE